MTLNQFSFWAIAIAVLTGCGGGNKTTTSDTTAPVVEIVYAEPLGVDKLYVTAIANDDNGITGYCFASAKTIPLATDECFSSAASKTIAKPTSSSPEYYVWAKDATNNISATYTIDLTPPSIASTSVSAPTSDGKVILSAVANDNTGVTGYCYSATSTIPPATDSCFTPAATKSIDTPTSTSPTYYVWAKDAAGNLSATFIKDITPPSIASVITSAPVNGKVSLSVTGTDNTGITGYCFSSTSTVPLANNSCFAAESTKSIDTPTSNSSTYYVWAKDAANNLSATFITDTTAPVIAAVTLSAPLNGAVTLTATPGDNIGVTGYCFKTSIAVPLASDNCFTTAATKSIDTPTSTSPTYYVWAKDAANNISATFVTDTTAPVIASIDVSAPISGQITVTARPGDNVGVTGYCFKASIATPSASDSCFTTSPTSPVTIPQTTPQYVWGKDAAGNVSAVFSAGCSATGLAASQASALPTVCVSTSQGEFVLALESTKAPITTTNFLRYVNDAFYSQTVFHRVISTFMIQGGGYTAVPAGTATEKAGSLYSAIQLETTTDTGLSNTTGTIAMARTGVLNSATREFFINVVDNTGLNTFVGGYAVFGSVISGLDTTVQTIRAVPVEANSGGEVSQPVAPPIINWAYQIK